MKIRMLLALLLAFTLLQGCSKNNNNNNNTTSMVRLVNTSTNTLDMVTSGAVLATGVQPGTVSVYSGMGSGLYPFTLEITGSGSPVGNQASFSLAGATNYTLVAYTSGQTLSLQPLTDNQYSPVPGYAMIRADNLSSDAGPLDVYLLPAGQTLSANSTPSIPNTTWLTAYTSITQGNYHIVVTGAGNPADLRLDLPSVTINSQDIMTLVLTSAKGGVLVDGLTILQQLGVAKRPNTAARIRVATNIAPNGGSASSVSATANGIALLPTVASPAIGQYFTVPNVTAGPLSLTVNVNGSPATLSPLTATAGSDLTLLLTGSAAAPQPSLLTDDNHLPPAGQSKLRLVNAINGLSDNLTLSVGYSPLTTALAVAPGTASAASLVSAGIVSQLVVNSSQATLYSQQNVNLQSQLGTNQAIFSLFMMGSNTAPQGILRQDR